MLSQTLPKLIELIRLQAGPQDLQPGWIPAGVLTFLVMAIGVLTYQFLGDADQAPRSLVATMFQVLMATLILRLAGKGERAAQTVSALCGVGVVFSLLSIPFLLVLNAEQPQLITSFLFLGLFIWSLVVDGHIYRHALSVKMPTGMLVAVLVFSGNYMLMRTLFVDSIGGN